ncbi:MAG: hypothetical protein IKH97_06895 [Bacteroidales bacterium]|nr:hypothetical protein [Bacteroidales bacterium]
MDDQYQLNKKPYLPPRLVSVAFKVEEAFASLRLLPNLDGGGPSTDSYSSAANSNSFWDSEVTSGGKSEEYTPFGWNW